MTELLDLSTVNAKISSSIPAPNRLTYTKQFKVFELIGSMKFEFASLNKNKS